LRQTTDGTKLTPKASAKSLSKADVESRLGSDSDGNDGPSPRETKESSGGSKEESKTQESASEDEEDEETADLGETLNLSSADMLEFLTSPTVCELISRVTVGTVLLLTLDVVHCLTYAPTTTGAKARIRRCSMLHRAQENGHGWS